MRTIAALFCLLTAVCGCKPPRQGEYPSRPIKVVVPFAAGGGSDTFARVIQRAIESQTLLPQKLVIVNVPGAGGTIGSRRVKNAPADGYTLLLLHEGILTSKHSGRAAYGPEAFEAIAGSGDATQVIAVSADSPYDDLNALISDASRRPEQIVFAANLGAPSHFAGLMLEQQRPGARFVYSPTGGGAKRFHSLQGGHVDVSAFSIAEFVQFQSAGMRALALLGPQRHPAVPDVMTAREQGFDVVSRNMQFWWAPKGTPVDRVAMIADAIESAMQSPAVRQRFAEMRIDPTFVRDDGLQQELISRETRIASVAQQGEDRVPDLARWVLWSTMLLGVIAWLEARGSTAGGPAGADADRADQPKDRMTLIMFASLTLAYVTVLATQWVGFRWATLVYVSASGWVVARRTTGWWSGSPGAFHLTLLTTAICLSFGVEYLFSQVLVVDLPR